MVGGDLLGHVFEHTGGGLAEQPHGGGFGTGAGGFLVEVAMFEVAGFAVKILAEQALESTHIEGLFRNKRPNLSLGGHGRLGTGQ